MSCIDWRGLTSDCVLTSDCSVTLDVSTSGVSCSEHFVVVVVVVLSVVLGAICGDAFTAMLEEGDLVGPLSTSTLSESST